MSVWLRMGRESIRLELLERWKRPPVLAPHPGALRERVREIAGVAPVEGPQPLALLEAGAQRDPAFEERRARLERASTVVLAVPDATRRGPWEAVLAATLRWVETLTPRADRRTVLIATGVHRPSIPNGFEGVGGWEIAVNGDGGYERHIAVGETPLGTPVRLHPAWVEAEGRVVLADLSFHYFAGFGGGRKLVFPGLGEPQGIMANHRRCLTDEGDLHPSCRSGVMDGNPVHQDLMDAVSFSPPDLLVQAYHPSPGRPIRVEVGAWRETHAAGCESFLRGHRLDHTHRPTVIIADAGGAPRDLTLLQAHKSMQHAARFLADGGRLLLVASLEEGSGSETFERLWNLDAPDLKRRAVASYELHTHTALAMRSLCSRFRVGIISRMEGVRLRGAGIVPFGSIADALAWIEEDGDPRAWGWLPRAEELLPRWLGASRGEGDLP